MVVSLVDIFWKGNVNDFRFFTDWFTSRDENFNKISETVVISVKIFIKFGPICYIFA